MVSHLRSIKRVAQLHWTWSKGPQEVDLWTNPLLWMVSAASKTMVCFAGNWTVMEKLVGLQYRSTGQPLLCVGRLYGCSKLPSEFWRVAGRSEPCFFWQGPMLEGLSNRTNMSRERWNEGLYNIILFRLECGGPGGLFKQSTSGMWEDCVMHIYSGSSSVSISRNRCFGFFSHIRTIFIVEGLYGKSTLNLDFCLCLLHRSCRPPLH